MKPSLFTLSYIVCVCGVVAKKTLLKKFTPMFSSKSFTVLALTFGSLIHFELTFWIWCEVGIQIHSLASSYPVVSAPFVEKNSFPNEWSWHPYEKIN